MVGEIYLPIISSNKMDPPPPTTHQLTQQPFTPRQWGDTIAQLNLCFLSFCTVSRPARSSLRSLTRSGAWTPTVSGQEPTTSFLFRSDMKAKRRHIWCKHVMLTLLTNPVFDANTHSSWQMRGQVIICNFTIFECSKFRNYIICARNDQYNQLPPAYPSSLTLC